MLAYIVGDEVTLPYPLDSMIDEKSRFLGRVPRVEMQEFLMDMRALKHKLFETATNSLEQIWTDFIPDVENRKKEKKTAPKSGQPVMTLEQAMAQKQIVTTRLRELRDRFLQPLSREFQALCPIDSVYTGVELKSLQSMIPSEIDFKPNHEHDPKAEGTNLLSFCLSGYRVQLIGYFSERVFALESQIEEPVVTEEKEDAGYADGTVLYEKSSYKYVPPGDDDDDALKPTMFRVSYVPIRGHGSRFVHFTMDAAFGLFEKDDAIREWIADYDKRRGGGKSKTESKKQNRESSWWRLYFKDGTKGIGVEGIAVKGYSAMEAMEKKRYFMSSFSSDGSAQVLLFFICHPVALVGVAVHFTFVTERGRAILNARYETQSKSAREFEVHKTWHEKSVKPSCTYGICNLEQLMLWADGGVTLGRDPNGKPMRVRIVGIDPNRVRKPPHSSSNNFQYLQSGTAAVAYVFETEAQVLDMQEPEKWAQVKRELEKERGFLWFANEDVSSSSFRIYPFFLYLLIILIHFFEFFFLLIFPIVLEAVSNGT